MLLKRTAFRLAFGAIASCLVVLARPTAAADAAWRWDNVERVVAFGDVHGAYRELVELLTRTGMIDAQSHWSGGTAHLVSVGDLLDRGPDSRAVMDLLMRLEKEAPTTGGYVHLVLGNHEAMNLCGDDRYASAADFASFAVGDGAPPPSAPRSEPSDVEPMRANGAGGPAIPPVRGQPERRAALSLDGEYGAWLAMHPALIVVNDTAYVHGGLSSLVADDVATLAARFHTQLLEAARAPNIEAPLLSDAGPLWYRGTARCHAVIEAARLQRVLDALAVRRVAIGHTPTHDRRIESRFGGAVVMLDTGMLEAVYHGRPQALVVEHGIDRVVTAGNPADAPIEPEAGGYAGDWRAVDALAATLQSAAVERVEPRDASGARAVALSTPNGSIEARFVPLPSEARRRELAAYRLDRLLGLGLVAPVAVRTIDRKQGVLLAADDWISERSRMERAIARANSCEVGSDLALMLAFDTLVGNPARSVDNLGYVRSATELSLRDFAHAFGTSGIRQTAAPTALPKLSPTLKDRLVALDRASLSGLDLRRREIDALLARRDEIVRTWPTLE